MKLAPFSPLSALWPFSRRRPRIVRVCLEEWLATLPSGSTVTTQIPGLTLTGAVLHRDLYSPGTTVLVDSGGPITIEFAQPIRTFSARFTYDFLPEVTGRGCGGVVLQFFDAHGNVLGLSASRFDSNLPGTGQPGSSPNELIGATMLKGAKVVRVQITGAPEGGSFAMGEVGFG